MIKRYTSKIFLIAFSLLTITALMSSSSGRGNIFGQAVTGAPGDTNLTCASAGCHSSGMFSPNGILTVKNEAGDVVNAYIPGETYDINLKIASTGNPSAFGFQMVALTENNTAATDWSSIGSNMQIVQLGERNYIEHNSPSPSNDFNSQWTAPSKSSGEVTFYYAVNAVNNNGSPSGDGASNASFTLSEFTTSSKDILEANITISPNPASQFILIDGIKTAFQYSLFDSNGSKIKSGQKQNNSPIEIANLNDGLYLLSIQVDDKIFTKKLLKK